jgi:hypothetical protein
MSGQAEVYEGSCLCNQVRYRVRGPLGVMDNCHCTDCRKSHGAAFATYIEVPWKSLEWISGKDRLETYTAGTGTKRSFCRTCGSTLLCWVESDDKVVELAAAALDTPIAARPRSHTFVRSKVSWFDILDGAPQFQTTRDTSS